MKPRTLIVEDEMLVALELEYTLKELGHEVVGIAADLTAAERYFNERLDLALVDLNLRDGLTGPQIGERLGESGVTILFVTANPNQIGKGIAGAIGVISKPTDADMVRAAVDYALRLRKGIQVDPPAFLRLFG